MDFYILTWLIGGFVIGLCIGWSFHALFIRWYLKKHVFEHPEYKLYADLLEGKTEERVK